MKQRFFLSGLIFLGSILIDQMTKFWGSQLSTLHYNQGLIMGFYADLPDSIRIVALSSTAGLVLFLYVLLMYIIPSRARALRAGLSFLVGGMFGNTIDKIRMGRTIDFIPFDVDPIHTVFNVADVFLWTGAVIILYMVLFKDKLIWYPESSRSNYLVRPREQYLAALNFTLVVFCCSLVLGVFSFTFFTTTVNASRTVMFTYFLTFSVITLFFCLLAFVGGIVISHKSVGPLYAFEQYVDHLLKGHDRKLTFRDGDNHRDLELVAEKLREYFKGQKG